MLSLTTSHPAGPLYTSLTERLRMLTDSENPHTLCRCFARVRGRQISQEISLWYVHTHTQVLSHRLAHTSSTLILIAALSSALPPPRPMMSPPAFPHFAICSFFLSYIVNNQAPSITYIAPWAPPKDDEEGSRWQLYPALRAPSWRLLHSGEVHCGLSGCVGAPAV